MSKKKENQFEKGTVIKRCREDRIFDAVIFIILTLILLIVVFCVFYLFCYKVSTRAYLRAIA